MSHFGKVIIEGVQSQDGTTVEEISADGISKSLVTIPTDHQRVHDGQFFNAGNVFTTVSNGSDADILIEVGSAATMHLRQYQVAIKDGPCTAYLYEGPTAAGGTAVTPYNMNRVSTATASCTITHTPTVTATGTLIDISYIPIPSKDAGASSQSLETEWILKTSTKYLLRVNNASGGNTDILTELRWYEP